MLAHLFVIQFLLRALFPPLSFFMFVFVVCMCKNTWENVIKSLYSVFICFVGVVLYLLLRVLAHGVHVEMILMINHTKVLSSVI